MSALIIVANPGDLGRYEPGGASLAPIDVGGELARARAALGQMQITSLAAPGQATVNQIREKLRHDFDILYLVCHGTYAQGQTIIWLEDEKGQAAPTAGEEQMNGAQEATDAQLRSIWLRQVQTRPADFLRAKFAHQYATRQSEGE